MTKLEFFEAEDAEGRLRVVIDDGSDEPPYMQSIGNYRMGTPIIESVVAAIRAAEPERDDRGLYWSSRAALKRALAAAREAAR